ncbi:MAG: hypothetical protein WCZ48_02405 [Bacillota bacterium]|nr:hypothetical protein [Bacillota bacterium]
MIADTQHERRLLQQMLVDACGNDSMPDIGALLVKLVVKDRAFAKYGAGAAVAVGEMTFDFHGMVREVGFRGVEALDGRIDEMLEALMS